MVVGNRLRLNFGSEVLLVRCVNGVCRAVCRDVGCVVFAAVLVTEQRGRKKSTASVLIIDVFISSRHSFTLHYVYLFHSSRPNVL